MKTIWMPGTTYHLRRTPDKLWNQIQNLTDELASSTNKSQHPMQ
ncbi:MAG: hypothetical protein ABSB14_14295 [Candidatus Sulfotelmatobacter sp.]